MCILVSSQILEVSMSELKRKFQKLSPTSNADISAYREALDFAFQQKDLKNIGLTGAFGAGKSSIIKSYEKASNGKRNFLYISLARFSDDQMVSSPCKDITNEIGAANKGHSNSRDKARQDQESSNNINDIVILEGKIINQLVHQIDENKIPKTSFRIKRQNASDIAISMTIGSVMFILASLYLFFFNSWVDVINSLDSEILRSLLSFTTRSSFLVLDIVLLTGLFGYALYKIILLQKDRRIIKKLSLKGNDIEVFSNCEESYFDKYLNDVIYLFENASVDAIVFEDIDRYKCVEIFQRLREVNELVNRRLEQEYPIRFFYLMRDDIFATKDRTKFFDFIIPVVPVVDSSNAYDILKDHFRIVGALNLFSDGFLASVSLYIDDLRVLYNICNEFEIYLSSIERIHPDYNKLFSLIIYKNLFPKDFAKLQLNTGFLNVLFEKHDSIAERDISEINKKIQSNNEQISRIEKEHLESVVELDAVVKVLKTNPATGSIKSDYEAEYNNRKQRILLRSSEETKKLKASITELEEQLKEIPFMCFSEFVNKTDNILNEISEANKDKYQEVLNSPYFGLLDYLVRNGYIDRNYHDYITYFYPNSISYSDKAFLMNVVGRKKQAYTTPISNPSLVIDRLSTNDLKQESTLNYSLLKCLLENHEEFRIELDTYITAIVCSNNLGFLSGYFSFNSAAEQPELVKIIVKKWPEFLTLLIHEQASNALKDRILVQFVKYQDASTLCDLDKNNEISEYLKQNISNLKIDNEDVKSLSHFLVELSIKIENINIETINLNLWQSIYSNNLYAINKRNIDMILVTIYGVELSGSYQQKYLTLVLSKETESLANYARKNRSEILSFALEACNSALSDDEPILIEFLNATDVNDSLKHELLQKAEKAITLTRSVSQVSLWPIILELNIKYIDPKGIVNYFCFSGFGLDEALVHAINRTNISFNLSNKAIDGVNPNTSSSFFRAVLSCNELNDIKYAEIIKAIGYVTNNFSVNNLETAKVDILIRNRILNMVPSILDNIRKNYPAQLSDFIATNPSKYCEIVSDKVATTDEISMAISIKEMHYTKKIALLTLTNDPISIVGKDYSPKIASYIIQHNFAVSDLSYILKNYDDLAKSAQSAILDIVDRYVSEIISSSLEIDGSLLLSLLEKRQIDTDTKFLLYANNLPSLTFEQSISCLKILKAQNLIDIFRGKKPIVEKSVVNTLILQSFRDRDWINIYSPITPQTYRVYGCKKEYRI